MVFQFPRNKDYYGGGFLLIVGVCAAYISRGYDLGTLAQMGPGFFPFSVGCLLGLAGFWIALSGKTGHLQEGKVSVFRHGTPDLRGGACLVLGVLAFIGLGERFGLLPATFAIVFVSALGDRDNTLREAAALSAVMMLIAYVVFHWSLQIQLPLLKWGV